MRCPRCHSHIMEGFYCIRCGHVPTPGKPRIVTTFVWPPIPNRCMDWAAYRDGYEPGGLIGRGHTEEDAIRDLKEQEENLL